MSIITFDQYFGPWLSHPDATHATRDNAIRLLDACHHLQVRAERDGVVFKTNPKTGNRRLFS